MNLKEWSQHILELNEAKPVLANQNTPEHVAGMIQGEAQELTDSIRNDEEAFGVGSELGDILYLTLMLCAQLGFDPEDLLVLKDCRNEQKYPKELLQQGNYNQITGELKVRWENMGGDKKFFDDY